MLRNIKRVLASLFLLLPGSLPLIAIFAAFCCVAPLHWIEALPAPLARLCVNARNWAHAQWGAFRALALWFA